MKINKNLNWKTFFLRLTIILSISSFIIGYSYFIDYYDDFLNAIVMSGIIVIFIWALYFGIRWVYSGLYKKEDTD